MVVDNEKVEGSLHGPDKKKEKGKGTKKSATVTSYEREKFV